jgi:hypothetical protein
LFTRAPCTRIMSWLSAIRGARDVVSVLAVMLTAVSLCYARATVTASASSAESI